MKENRITAIALALSLGIHIAIIGAYGGFFQAQDKDLLHIQALPIEKNKTPLLPEIRIIGEFKQLKSADSQQSIDHGQKNEDKAFNNTEIKRLLAVEPKVVAPDEADEAMLRYQDMVKQRIESNRNYPMRAQRMHLEGTVDLAFVINADGNSRNVRVIQSSGSKFLDEQALDTIRKASPFMSLPEEIGKSSVDIRVAIVYSLQ
ncbi:MAG: energy transducer TonB [Candidatus Omnitrophota bacterium]